MLREKFNEALKEGLRSRNENLTGTVRLIIAEMKKRDIEARPKGNMDGISDDEILSMMQGMIKQRRESISLYEKGNRADLAAKEAAEITVIESFMPQQMSEEEVKAAIAAAVAATGAASVKDMGKVMGELKKAYTGRMDFAQAGALVKTVLAG